MQFVKIHVLVVASASPFLHYNQICSGQVSHILMRMPMLQIRCSCKVLQNAGGGFVVPHLSPDSLFPLEKQRLCGDLYTWCCAGLGERQCSQHVATSLTLLMQSTLFSVVQEGASVSSPCSIILSVVSYS